MENQNILVLGATGKTGSRIVNRLLAQGKNIRSGSRNAAIPFDWEDKSTWKQALDGMDSIYIAFQPDLAVPGAKDKISDLTTMCVEAGIKKIVLLSGKGEHEAQLCENIVKQSGINWTIVRASWFNQNFSEGFFVDAIQSGHVALPNTDALVPYVDADDIADVAVKALLEADSGETYELTGPDQLTFEQAIAEISKAANREIKFSSISMEEYKEILGNVGLPADYIWLIEYLFTEVLTLENSVITHDIEKVLDRKPISFAEYAQQAATTGVWNAV